MLGVSTLVQPYAIAAFDYATENNVVEQWQTALQQLGEVVKTDVIVDLLKNPSVANAVLLSELVAACKAVMSDALERFLHVLMQNDRLALIPHVSEAFSTLYAKRNNLTNAELVSCFEVTDAQLSDFKKALESRLDSQVTLTCRQDASLLGGAVVQIDDWVFDGSIKGKLARLKNSLFEANL